MILTIVDCDDDTCIYHDEGYCTADILDMINHECMSYREFTNDDGGEDE